MSPLITVGVVVVSVPLLAVLILSYIRAVSPYARTRKIAAEQAHLDKKTGTDHRATSPTASSSIRKGLRQPKMKFVWSFLLVLAAAAVFYLGLYSSEWKTPSVAGAGSWSWQHWFPLLVLWGIFAAFIALNAKEKVGKTLQGILAWVVIGAFAGLPLIGLIPGTEGNGSGGGLSQQMTRHTIETFCQNQQNLPSLPAPVTINVPPGGTSEHLVAPFCAHVTATCPLSAEHRAVFSGGKDCSVTEGCSGLYAYDYIKNLDKDHTASCLITYSRSV